MRKFLACGCELVNKSAAVSALIALYDGSGKHFQARVYTCTTGKHSGFSPVERIESDGLVYRCESTTYVLSRVRESGYEAAVRQ